jgi:hypothetical protein
MNDKVWLAQWFKRLIAAVYAVSACAFAVMLSAIIAWRLPEYPWLWAFPAVFAALALVFCIRRAAMAEGGLIDPESFDPRG